MTKGYFASTIEKYYLLNSEEVVTSMREKLKSESSRYQNRDQFLVYPNGNINFSSIDELAFVLSDLKNQNKEIILVSSGAIGVGMNKLNIPQRPVEIPSNKLLQPWGKPN